MMIDHIEGNQEETKDQASNVKYVVKVCGPGSVNWENSLKNAIKDVIRALLPREATFMGNLTW